MAVNQNQVSSATFVADFAVGGQSAVCVHSDGTLAVAYREGATNSFKVATSPDGVTWTVRATLTPGVTIGKIAMAQFSGGNLALVVRSSDGLTIKYNTITWSTWAVGSWVTAFTITSPTSMVEMDIDVTDGGAVLVAGLLYNTSNGFHQMRMWSRSTGGTWNQIFTNNQYTSGTRRSPLETVAVCAMGSSGANLREIVLASGEGNNTTDNGIRVWSITINESTNAVVNALTLRSTHMAGSCSTSVTTGKLRHARLFRASGVSATSYMLAYINQGAASADRVTSTHIGQYSAGSWAQYSSEVKANWASGGSFAAYGMFGISADSSYNVAFHIGRLDSASSYKRVTEQTHLGQGGTTWLTYDSTILYEGTNATALLGVSDGPKRNLDKSKLDCLFQIYLPNIPSQAAPIYHWREGVPTGAGIVTSTTPANGDPAVIATPVLKGVVDTNEKYSHTWYRVQFEFAKDSGFTTSVVDTYVGSFAKVDGTNTAGVTVTFSDTLLSPLSGGTWYLRARLVDLFGNVGTWTTTRSFYVTHPSTAVLLSPGGTGYYAWNGGQRDYVWQFEDTYEFDAQTAYQVQIKDGAGTVIYDSGKVTSGSQTASVTLAGTYKDVMLQWTVQVWDSLDETQGYVTPEWFILTDPPTFTITHPTSSEVFATSVPTFTFTPSTGGGRRIKTHTVLVTQGPNVIWSKTTQVDIASGTSQDVKVALGYLLDGGNYSFQVIATDSAGVIGQSAVVPFTTDWTPPTAPATVTADAAAYSGSGYVQVVWNDAQRDTTNFAYWAVYRKSDMVDASGAVVIAGTYELIYKEYNTGAGYAYNDYLAPSQYKSTYSVRQVINLSGMEAESLDSPSNAVTPVSDSYWLIDTTDESNISTFRLSLVTGDSFTDEQEETEFTVIGRGRVGQKGQFLGPKGTLDVRLRNTNSTTARYKRLKLREIQQNAGEVYLRNPFGDVFKVNVSSIQIGRIAGVGTDEFCDASIPYAEVG